MKNHQIRVFFVFLSLILNFSKMHKYLCTFGFCKKKYEKNAPRKKNFQNFTKIS